MKSLEELKAIREKMQGQVGVRSADATDTRVVVGMATCGIASGARPVLNTLVNEVNEKKVENVTVTQTGCIGLCQYEPIVEVFEPGQEKITYVKVNPEKAKEIVEKHLIKGQRIEEYMLKKDADAKNYADFVKFDDK
ncbi:MAG: (2Fe-2S) ferredoxin domain-containing protein [Lachnospiraceae bacterium]|nr:(2Fe-2S) ferredoxin domain-containing protein [Lachnospiraceae bacterium]